MTAHGLKEVLCGSWKVLPVQPGFVAVHLHCLKHLVMYELTHLMAQEKPPFLWSHLSNSQYISIWETTASKGHTNLKRLCYGSGEREIKLFWNVERWRVIVNMFHELTQQFSMVKRARPFSLHKMAQFRMIPPETGINNTSLQCWSTRLGWRMAPLCTAHPLHYHGRPDVSGRIQCRTAALPSHTPISLPPCHTLPQTDSWLPAALLHKNPARLWFWKFSPD